MGPSHKSIWTIRASSRALPCPPWEKTTATGQPGAEPDRRMPGEAQVSGFHQTHNADAECFMNWKDFTSQEGRQGKGGMWNMNSSIRDTGSISAVLWFMSTFWLHCLLHSSPPKESESPDDLLKGSVTYKQNPATQYFWLSLTEVNALAAFPSALPFQRKNLPVDTKSLLPLEKWLSQTGYVQILACQFTRALRQVASPYCEWVIGSDAVRITYCDTYKAHTCGGWGKAMKLIHFIKSYL